MSVPVVEYWVMRVLLHESGRPLQMDMLAPGVRIATRACVETGTLAMLPDGSICEPVEVFDVEEMAHEHRSKLQGEHKGADFRVVLTAGVTV